MKKKTKMKPSDFFTRTPSNTGVRMPLLDPITDEPTQEWLQCLGIDSDVFQDALSTKARENLRIIALPEGEQDAAQKKAQTELVASLVEDWSFDDFSLEAVTELLHESPSIKRQVDRFVNDLENFIKKPSEN